MNNESEQTAFMSDEAIIKLFWERNERAIKETDIKYRRYLHKIAYNILYDDLDCEECLNDTYLGAWNAIPPAKPNVLKAFLAVIARRSAIDRYRISLRKRSVPSEMTVALSELEEFTESQRNTETDFDAVMLGQMLSGFIRSLPERRQIIFVGRYYYAYPIDAIAKKLGLSRSTVHKELAAIRGELKEKLKKEGYII